MSKTFSSNISTMKYPIGTEKLDDLHKDLKEKSVNLKKKNHDNIRNNRQAN